MVLRLFRPNSIVVDFGFHVYYVRVAKDRTTPAYLSVAEKEEFCRIAPIEDL